TQSHVLQDQFYRLQHPDPRNRNPGNLCCNRSGCRGRVQRYALPPQSFLRTGILRRFASGGSAWTSRHALWAQRNGRRDESRLGQAHRSLRGDGIHRCRKLQQSPLGRHDQHTVWDDKLGVRIAGEWTKRDGYSFNETTGKPIDGRDLWSGRVTIGLKPVDRLQIYAIWEHFQEDDDRIRSSKQLCKKDPGPTSVDG